MVIRRIATAVLAVVLVAVLLAASAPDHRTGADCPDCGEHVDAAGELPARCPNCGAMA